MANSEENFVIDFGFSGKEALEGLKRIDKALDNIRDKLREINGLSLKMPRTVKIDTGEGKTPTPGSGGRKGRDPNEVLQDKVNRFRGTRAMLQLAERDAEAATRAAERFKKATKARDFEEVGRVRKEVADLNREFDRGVRKMDKNKAAAERLRRKMFNLHTVTSSMVATLTMMGTAGAIAGVGIFGMTRMVIQAGRTMESLNASMLVASGNSRLAAEDMDFVKQNAMELGADLESAARGYMKLATASQGVITRSEMQDLFRSTLEVSTALGLSADETAGSIRAFEQMASKGRVTAEELKGQLGERLPGALALAAKAMNTTTDGIFRMMEAGQLSAKEFLPKMASAMSNLAKESGGLSKALKTVRVQEARLRNSFLLFREEVANNGVNKAYSELLDTLSEFFDITNKDSEQTREAMATLSKLFLQLANVLVEKALPAIEKLAERFNDYYDGLVAVHGEKGAMEAFFDDLTEAAVEFAVKLAVLIASLKTLKVLIGAVFTKGLKTALGAMGLGALADEIGNPNSGDGDKDGRKGKSGRTPKVSKLSMLGRAGGLLTGAVAAYTSYDLLKGNNLNKLVENEMSKKPAQTSQDAWEFAKSILRDLPIPGVNVVVEGGDMKEFVRYEIQETQRDIEAMSDAGAR